MLQSYRVGAATEAAGSGDYPEPADPEHPAEPTGAAAPRVAPVGAELGTGAPVDGPSPGETAKITVDSGGMTRSAIVSLPGDYYPGTPTPVLLAYPGYGQTASEMKGFTGLQDVPAIVVFMQGVQNTWEGAPYSKTSDGQDIRFSIDMLAALNSTYNLDRTRIYAVGMSNGGGFAAKLACRHPDIFAAVAAVSAAYYPGTGGNCSTPSTSFLDIHGVLDDVIGYSGGARHGVVYQPARERAEVLAERNGCSPDPVTTSLAGDVRRVQWTMCRGDRDVVHLRVGDGGHTWPGDSTGTSGGAEPGARQASDTAEATSYSLDATGEVWAFVRAHQLGS